MIFFEICSKKWCANLDVTKICITFVPDSEANYMVDVAQRGRVTDCGSEGRGFESHLPPLKAGCEVMPRIFFCLAEVCKQVSTPAKQKKELRSSCFQGWKMGNCRVTSVVYLRTATSGDCGTPSVMTRKRDIQIPSSRGAPAASGRDGRNGASSACAVANPIFHSR